MTRFSTQMEATVRVPAEGFTQDDLRSHLRASKIPADALLVPTIVVDVDPEPDPEMGGTQETRREVGFIAKWTPS